MNPQLTPAVRENLASAAAESPDFPWLLLSAEGDVVAAGPAVEAIAGDRTRIASALSDGAVAELLALGAEASGASAETLVHLTDPEGGRHSVIARVVRIEDNVLVTGRFPHGDHRRLVDEFQQMANELTVLSREYKRQARELEATMAERDRSYWHLKRIQEVLPICMDCGTIKPDSDWTSVADYLHDNEIQLSHGLCPVCLSRRREERAAG